VSRVNVVTFSCRTNVRPSVRLPVFFKDDYLFCMTHLLRLCFRFLGWRSRHLSWLEKAVSRDELELNVRGTLLVQVCQFTCMVSSLYGAIGVRFLVSALGNYTKMWNEDLSIATLTRGEETAQLVESFILTRTPFSKTASFRRCQWLVEDQSTQPELALCVHLLFDKLSDLLQGTMRMRAATVPLSAASLHRTNS
jgi:hypothetical protein